MIPIKSIELINNVSYLDVWINHSDLHIQLAYSAGMWQALLRVVLVMFGTVD